MTDLRKTQPEWTRFVGRELGFFLAVLRELEELEAKYTKQRTRVVVLGDVSGNVGAAGVELVGVDLGVNTSVDGVLFVRVVGQVDPRVVRLARAPGGAAGDVVAEGQGNAGSLVALTDRNSSDLRGSWSLSKQPVEDLTDRLRLFPVPDWAARLRRVWDGSVEKDVQSADEALAMLVAVAARIADARQLVRDALALFATAEGSRGAEFVDAVFATLVEDGAVRDPSGSVVRRRTGFVPALGRAMAEETLAGSAGGGRVAS